MAVVGADEARLDGVLAFEHCGFHLNVFHLPRCIWRAFIVPMMRQERMTAQTSGESSADSSMFCLREER